MTGVFNVKKLAIWHAIAPIYGAMTVIIMDMLSWTAQIRYCHLAHQHTTGLTPMTGMKDPPPDIIATPDVHTMITRLDPDSVTPDLALVTTDIGVVATRTPIEVAPGHSTDLPAIDSHVTGASSSYHYCCNTLHCRPSSHRNTSRDDSRSRHKSQKQHYRLARGSSSTLQASSWKHKDKRHKQVTTDDPPSEYYSSDDNDSDSEDDLN